MTSQLLNPPAPPIRRSATEIPLGLTGWGIRVSPDYRLGEPSTEKGVYHITIRIEEEEH